MEARFPATASAINGDEDWELCNDDGFVYKGKKRGRISGGAGETSKPPDPELEERNGRERKKRILVKLKRKYQREIAQWEILSNSLNAMQEKSDGSQLNAKETMSFRESSSASGPGPLDQLLLMAEAQEVIINNVSNLCQVAENICRMEEEKKQPFFELDVWCSPTDLMVSLCAN